MHFKILQWLSISDMNFNFIDEQGKNQFPLPLPQQKLEQIERKKAESLSSKKFCFKVLEKEVKIRRILSF